MITNVSTSRNYLMLGLFLLLVIPAFAQEKSFDYFKGNNLYGTVEKFVSLGEHRTGTPADFATSEWLGKELSAVGYTVKYYEFSLKQFFPEATSVTAGNKSFKAFPLWYVGDSIKLAVEGVLVADSSTPENVSGKVVVVNFSLGSAGDSGPGILKKLNDLIAAGAVAVVGYTENEAGEIVALNAPKAAKSWKAPVVIVSPVDAKKLITLAGQAVKVSIKGSFKNVKARNVYGTLGTGDQHIVISTPISGWFSCGGERGPGIATWLALAKWAASQKLPYTFVFTGNSGHELGGWGAKAFLDGGAPPVDKTKLWIHLGAGIATLSWKSTPNGLVKENTVDPKRNFFYSTSTKPAFDQAFKNIAGNKWDTRERAGGELIYVIDKGYKYVAGVAYSHPYFHMQSDDATKTSPQILEEVALAFKSFLENTVKQ